MENKNESLMKTFHFMSGLPRSGSTLISSILNQNPKIYSGPSSPVVPTMLALENSLSNDELYLAYPKPKEAAQIISSVLPIFYSDVNKPIIIDKNRSWVNRLHYIQGYFGIEPKVLYPVRNIDEILTSFITMYRRNPFNGQGKISFLDDMLIKSNIPLSDDARCRFLCSDMGIIGQSYNGLKQVFAEGKQKFIHLIEYDDLMNNPKETMKKIYDFLEEDYYEHDFNNIENKHRENDKEIYGLSDMHEVRKSLGKVSSKPEDILSNEIFNLCKETEFWRDSLEEVDASENFFEENDLIEKKEQDNKIIGI